MGVRTVPLPEMREMPMLVLRWVRFRTPEGVSLPDLQLLMSKEITSKALPENFRQMGVQQHPPGIPFAVLRSRTILMAVGNILALLTSIGRYTNPHRRSSKELEMYTRWPKTLNFPASKNIKWSPVTQTATGCPLHRAIQEPTPALYLAESYYRRTRTGPI